METGDEPSVDREEVTLLLKRIGEDSEGAREELLALVYGTLRRIAQNRMKWERKEHTLQATELVHEAYLRIAGDLPEQDWQNRGHFYHAASEAMRRILIEYARKKGSQKRGGDFKRVPSSVLDLAAAEDMGEEILALDEAFQRLEEMDPRAGEIVRLRFFAGLSVDETAEELKTSRRTVLREWEFARAWMYSQLQGDGE